MNKTILKLIESDIINFKLIGAFNGIGIDASDYSTDMSKLIFQLIGIKKIKRTDELYFEYFKMVKEGKNIEVDSKEELSKLSFTIYSKLLSHCE